jgi:hypothetical protein
LFGAFQLAAWHEQSLDCFQSRVDAPDCSIPKMSDAAEMGSGGISNTAGRSAKCESQQARAKQHQARRGYREESIGHEVIMMHRSPATPDADPNLLKDSKSAVWQWMPRNEIRPSNEGHQVRGRGKCCRSSGPKPL